MVRTYPTPVKTDLQSAAPLPVWCIEIDTGTSPSVLRLTSREHVVRFGANDFDGVPVEVGEIRLEGGAEGELVLSVASADPAISPTIDFRGREVRVYYTAAGATGAGSSTSDSIYDTFLVSRVERRQGLITFRCLTELAFMEAEDLPGGIITREEFPGIPPSGSVV